MKANCSSLPNHENRIGRSAFLSQGYKGNDIRNGEREKSHGTYLRRSITSPTSTEIHGSRVLLPCSAHHMMRRSACKFHEYPRLPPPSSRRYQPCRVHLYQSWRMPQHQGRTIGLARTLPDKLSDSGTRTKHRSGR